MKLSMWLLADELEEFSPWSSIPGGMMEIENVQIFQDGEPVSAENVYIGYSAEYFGNRANQVLLAHGRDIILVNDADLLKVLNRVVFTFSKYQKWGEKLNDACHTSNPYQAVLDVAHEIFQCSMFFGNVNLHIYAITRQYSSEQVYDEWDDVKALNTIPTSLLEKMRSFNYPKQYPDTINPAVMPKWPGCRFEYHIRTNCYLDDELWGHFFIHYRKNKVSPAVLQLMTYVAEIYGKILQNKQEKGLGKYTAFSSLFELLDGNTVPKEVIRTYYRIMKWSSKDSFVLYKISTASQGYDDALFPWLCNNINEMAADTIVFPYKFSIIVIGRDDKWTKSTLEIISGLIKLSDYHCGISFSFRDLSSILTYYNQAGYALDMAPEKGIKLHYYEDCKLEGFAKEIMSHMNWREWISPSLFALIETDASQGTSYFMTLYQLILNGFHLGNAAKALYIHRNTLIYRLDKIKSMLDVDFHDIDTMSYLRLCCSMIMYAPNGLIPPVAQVSDSGAHAGVQDEDGLGEAKQNRRRKSQ